MSCFNNSTAFWFPLLKACLEILECVWGGRPDAVCLEINSAWSERPHFQGRGNGEAANAPLTQNAQTWKNRPPGVALMPTLARLQSRNTLLSQILKTSRVSLTAWLWFNCRRLLGELGVNEPCMFLLSSRWLHLCVCVCVCLKRRIGAGVWGHKLQYHSHNCSLKDQRYRKMLLNAV